ncbi:ubiquinol-cytochrome C chaperone family protein [Pseudomonadota bacterium]
MKALLKKLGLVKPDPAAVALYQAAVQEARREIHFTDWRVPDTVDGRFDMISLMVALVNRRIGLCDPSRVERIQALAQELFDVMFKDMDINLRELGVSDEGMKHRIKPMASAHLGRVKAYTDVLGIVDESERRAEMVAALDRNVYRVVEDADPAPLAARVLVLAEHLDGISDDDILAGRFAFLDLKE